MRIIHVVTLGPFDRLGTPGPCNVALQQLHSLRREGCDCVLLTTHASDTGVIDTVRAGTSVVSYPRRQFLPRALSTAFSLGLIKRTLRESRERSTVVHLHCSRDFVFIPLMLALRCLRRNYVCQPHGQIQSTSRLRRLVDKFLVSHLLNGSSAVLCLQKVESERLVEMGVHSNRIEVLPNRIDLPEYSDRFRNQAASLAVGFVAHLRAEKRVDLAIQLCAALCELGLDHELVVAGADGGDLKLVRDAIQCGLPIRYLGSLDRDCVWSTLRTVDLLLFPSDDEPFGMSFVEGLSVGTPAVCGPGMHVASGLTEGDGVIQVDFNQPDSAALAVRASVLDPAHWSELSKNARQWVGRNLAADGYGASLLSIYGGKVRLR